MIIIVNTIIDSSTRKIMNQRLELGMGVARSNTKPTIPRTVSLTPLLITKVVHGKGKVQSSVYLSSLSIAKGYSNKNFYFLKIRLHIVL